MLSTLITPNPSFEIGMDASVGPPSLHSCMHENPVSHKEVLVLVAHSNSSSGSPECQESQMGKKFPRWPCNKRRLGSLFSKQSLWNELKALYNWAQDLGGLSQASSLTWCSIQRLRLLFQGSNLFRNHVFLDPNNPHPQNLYSLNKIYTNSSPEEKQMVFCHIPSLAFTPTVWVPLSLTTKPDVLSGF